MRGRCTAEHCADDIRNKSIGCPVTAADDVARADRRDARAVLEEGTAVGRDHELGRALAAAVGVVPAHRIAFAIGPDPLAVFVAFVAGDGDDGANAFRPAAGVEQMHRAHDVGRVGLDRIVVRIADERLGSEVEDDLRLAPHSRPLRPHPCRGRRLRCGSRARRAGSARRGSARSAAAREKPVTSAPSWCSQSAQPAALEAGVARDEDSASLPGGRFHQHFQGAPSCHSSSR